MKPRGMHVHQEPTSVAENLIASRIFTGTSNHDQPTVDIGADNLLSGVRPKAAFVGNCVNSFNDDGQCVIPSLPFASVSDFACAEEDCTLIARSDFLDRVNLLEELIPLAMQEGTEFMDLGKKVLALYEPKTDIHYFFVTR